MKIEQGAWTESGGSAAFGDRVKIAALRAMYPRAHLLGCSTAGGTPCELHNQTMTVTTFTEI